MVAGLPPAGQILYLPLRRDEPHITVLCQVTGPVPRKLPESAASFDSFKRKSRATFAVANERVRNCYAS